MTGYPCSGLTYRGKQLASLLEASQDEFLASTANAASKLRYKIYLVPTHDSSHPRTDYDNARTEKEARGVAYARAKRALGRDSIVILDGMNYIKGWRYQLWCEAKAAGTTCCVVHVGTPIDQCIANNEARLQRRIREEQAQQNTREGDPNNGCASSPDATTSANAVTCERKEEDNEEPYPSELLNNLIFRYEEPSTHSRWDKPLFTVPWSDAEPPIADIWTALTGTSLPSTSTAPAETPVSNLITSLASITLSSTASIATRGTSTTQKDTLSRPRVKQHQATIQAPASDPTALYSIEKRTSAIVSAIRNFTLSNPSAEAALAQSPNPDRITIPVPEASEVVVIPADVAVSGTTDELAGAGGILALPRLQRLRRQWIGLNRAYVGHNRAGPGLLTLDQVGDAFVRFLNADFAGEH